MPKTPKKRNPTHGDFFKRLNAEKEKIRRGEQPTDRLGKLVYYNEKLHTSDVSFEVFDNVINKKPIARENILRDGKTSFEFHAPRVMVSLKKGTNVRTQQLLHRTLETIDPARLKPELEKIDPKLSTENLQEAGMELQKRLDRGENVGELLYGVQLATAVSSDSQLDNDLHSKDSEKVVNALHNLHIDRFEDVKREHVNDPRRIKALREFYAEKFGVPVESLPATYEDARKALKSGAITIVEQAGSQFSKEKRSVRGDSELQKLKSKWRPQVRSFLMSFDSNRDLYYRPAASFRKAIKGIVSSATSEKSKNMVKVTADFNPSFTDFFAGYTSGDCTKGTEERKLNNGMIVGRLHEDGKHIGNAYLLKGKVGESPVMHIDVLQPLRSRVDQEHLIRGFVNGLHENLDPRFKGITANRDDGLFSNHANTRKGYLRFKKSVKPEDVTVKSLPSGFHSSNTNYVLLKKR